MSRSSDLVNATAGLHARSANGRIQPNFAMSASLRARSGHSQTRSRSQPPKPTLGLAARCETGYTAVEGNQSPPPMEFDRMNAPLRIMIAASLGAMLLGAASEALAAVRIDGQVQAGGGPVASSTVIYGPRARASPNNSRKRKRRLTGALRSARTRRRDRASASISSPMAASQRSTRARATIRRLRSSRCSAARLRPKSSSTR